MLFLYFSHMNTPTTINSDEVLVIPHTILAKYQSKTFTVVPLEDSIVIEPSDDEHASHYELTPEEEHRLETSISQANRGEAYPVETLFTETT